MRCCGAENLVRIGAWQGVRILLAEQLSPLHKPGTESLSDTVQETDCENADT